MYNKFTSFPIDSFIAQSFGTTTDYLYGLTDDASAAQRLFAYWQKINAD